MKAVVLWILLRSLVVASASNWGHFNLVRRSLEQGTCTAAQNPCGEGYPSCCPDYTCEQISFHLQRCVPAPIIARKTASPTAIPTISPTLPPTLHPTESPSLSPTRSPSQSPSLRPTPHPTPRPTPRPTSAPTPAPRICVLFLCL